MSRGATRPPLRAGTPDGAVELACCMSSKDVFVLPAHPTARAAAMQQRRRFAAGAASDQLASVGALFAYEANHARN